MIVLWGLKCFNTEANMGDNTQQHFKGSVWGIFLAPPPPPENLLAEPGGLGLGSLYGL